MTYRIFTCGVLLLIAAAVATCAADGARAEDKPMTIGDALQIRAGLQGLDGQQVVVKGQGGESVAIVPWQFKSGTLRLAIAANLAELDKLAQATDQARQGVVKEILKGSSEQSIKPGTPQMEDFTTQYNQMLTQPYGNAGKLQPIDAKALNLDVNEIPASTLAALHPILR